MIREQAEINSRNRKAKRGEPKKPSKAQIKRQLMKEADTWQERRDIDLLVDVIEDEPLAPITQEELPVKKTQTRRRSYSRRKEAKK